jgi:hypothetical protein
MRLSILVIVVFLSSFAGCVRQKFVLTDDSAMHALLATEYVEDLQARNPSRLACFVEAATPGARYVYLGEDHDDHTVRLRACRVTADGRVWVNADETLLEDRWVLIE